ncbi:MAG: ribonuclease P protein component [Hyphomicrobium sp.]
MALETLKSRPDFLAVRGGRRASVPICLLEARQRVAGRTAHQGARFGFTITKKLGGAVVRNRIRRRLKAAVMAVGPELASDGFDYVIVARSAALNRPFAEVVADLSRALETVHKPQGTREQRLDKRANTMKKPGHDERP